SIKNLELLTDTELFSRDEKVPVLTAAGRALLPEARRLVDDADALATRARRFADGVEPRLAVCIDAVFPTAGVVAVAQAFAKAFPDVELALFTESLSAVTALVKDRVVDIGVCLPPADLEGLVATTLGEVRLVPVVHREHALAKKRGAIPSRVLDEHVQIVLSERGAAKDAKDGTPDQGVLSGRTWRVVDLETKQALIAAGLGWGNLPEHRLQGAAGRDLIEIDVAAWGRDRFRLELCAAERRGVVPGPAARFLKDALAVHCQPTAGRRRR
ncbi:MAG TPA: LysR family transcriptional regulator, partial [Myxococcota bacterium]